MNQPASNSFRTRWDASVERSRSLVCCGLDPDIDHLPSHLRIGDPADAISQFCLQIVEATHDCVSAYKPNFAFFLRWGIPGIEALLKVKEFIPTEIPVILDCKVGDLGNSSASYAAGLLDEWGFDAITVNPYLGEDSLTPFFERSNHGAFVLARTSNPDSRDIQRRPEDREPIYRTVASSVSRWQVRYPGTIGLVAGATWPEELAEIRGICPDSLILLPGVGAQSGNLEDALNAGLDDDASGLLVSVSRSVIFAGDGPEFAKDSRRAVQDLNRTISAFRESLDTR